MLNTSIRVSGDTSGLQSAFDQAGNSADKLRDKVSAVSDSLSNIQNPNINLGNNGTDNGFNSAAVQNAYTQAVTQQGQVIQQIVHNSNNGNSGNGSTGNVTNAVSNMFNGEGGAGLVGVLSKAGPVGAGLALLIGGLSLGNKTVQQWEKQIPSVTGAFNKLTSGLGGNTEKENSALMRDMFDTINNQRYQDNTIYKNEDYMALMSDMSSYGYTNYNAALKDASQVLKFQNAGMGSRSQLASMQGLAQRFGLEGALNSAFAGLEMSGMQKGQFDEFLSSMEDILESGISKGFVKAADEISTDLTMLETLSGGSKLWQGQYGAENLSQMNSALENATSLSSVNDVMLYRAMSGLDENTRRKILGDSYTGDSYLDTQMILERGVNSNNIGAIFDIVNAEGGTERDKIARYKNMFGVSYTKAMDIYNMSKNYTPAMAESIAASISGYTADTGNVSMEQQLNSAYETAAAEVQKMGAAALGAKEGLMKLATYFADVKGADEVLDISKVPFSGDEVDVFASMLENYDGQLSSNELIKLINGRMENEAEAVWSDYANIQNLPGLKEAWETRNGTAFFDLLFNKNGAMYESTPFGLMTTEDAMELSGTKGYKDFYKQTKDMTREEIEDMIAQYFARSGKTSLDENGSILGSLQELIRLVRDGDITLKTSAY